MKTFRINILYRSGDHIISLSTTMSAHNEQQAYERVIEVNGICKSSIVNPQI